MPLSFIQRGAFKANEEHDENEHPQLLIDEFQEAYDADEDACAGKGWGGDATSPTTEPSLYGCPPAYDPSAASSYGARSEVEVDRVAYRCGAYPFSIYCTLPQYRPLSTEDVEWDYVVGLLKICG